MNVQSIGAFGVQGYLIRHVEVYISNDMFGCAISPTIELYADVMKINKNIDNWAHSQNVTLKLDIDKEKFLFNNEEICIVNGDFVFKKIMKIIAGAKNESSLNFIRPIN
jgi:hypothetical protein